MSEADERMERLEGEVRRLRAIFLGLGLCLAATFSLALKANIDAIQELPDELALRRLAIVDADGKERIVAATRPEGEADLSHYDTDGKMRISAGTSPKGDANVQHFDPGGTQRINVGTGSAGEVVPESYDGGEKNRIGALRFPDGYSGIALRSSNGEAVWMKTSE
jgi:hypothetical protein